MKNINAKKIILEYIEENPNDKEYIKSHIGRYPELLEYVDRNIFDDLDFCKQILTINGMLLEFMPEKIKSNKELVIIAIKNSVGFAICFADKELRKDIDIVKYAILKYKFPLVYASEDLQLYFMEKWNEYYLNNKERKWSGYKVFYNGIRTPKDEMYKIYKNNKVRKKSKKEKEEIKKNEEYEAIKDFLAEQQIKFNEYSFEENDEN